jgi:hypothetical protein
LTTATFLPLWSSVADLPVALHLAPNFDPQRTTGNSPYSVPQPQRLWEAILGALERFHSLMTINFIVHTVNILVHINWIVSTAMYPI